MKDKKNFNLVGEVVSIIDTSSAKVQVKRTLRHFSGKFISRSSFFICNYSDRTISTGDTVSMHPVKPISKTKHFHIQKTV